MAFVRAFLSSMSRALFVKSMKLAHVFALAFLLASLLIPLAKWLLLLGHKPLQGLTKGKGGSIALEIGLGGLVAPWLFGKGTIGRAFLFEVNDRRIIAPTILETLLVQKIA
jgi:hypothetical protein